MDFAQWGYLGVVLGILATGIPFVPIPEELPVVMGGFLVAHGLHAWIMLPACIVAVVVGDFMLYGIGRTFGTSILNTRWVKKHVLPPERQQKIEANFKQHGVKILLFARLTPGIRAPIFVTAGILKLPWPVFVLADGIYAIPGVTLLFFLGFWFTDGILNLLNNLEHVKSIIMIVVVVGIAGYFTYRFLRRPMVTGDPTEMPPMVGKMTHTFEQVTHRLEDITVKIIHPGGKDHKAGTPDTVRLDSAATQRDGQPPDSAADVKIPDQEKK